MKSFLPIILIIIAVGLFFFQIKPLYSEVKGLRAEAKQYDEALKMADELKEIRVDLAHTLAGFPKADLERLDHFLPRRLDTVRIILDVNSIGLRNGVRLNGMKVSVPSLETGKVSAGQSGSNYSTIDISFSFSATYVQGVQFIQDLQRSLRLLDSTSLSVKPSPNNPVFYDFDMTLQTYWINR